MLITSATAAKILNQTLTSARRRLYPPDDAVVTGDTQKNYYDEDRVKQMVADDKKNKTGAYRVRKPLKVYKRTTVSNPKVKYSKNTGMKNAELKPQYCGSHCRECKKYGILTPVATGVWNCRTCTKKLQKIDVGRVDDNYTY